MLTTRLQNHTGYASFAGGTRSSYIVTLQIGPVRQVGTGRDTAEVSFTSLQDSAHGHDGQTCSEWQLTYTMLATGSGWQIDSATPHAGSPASC